MEQKGIPWFIVEAYAYGLMMKGWNLEDYVMNAAISNDGYEVIICIGVQRSGKSNESLQLASWAKHASIAFTLNHVSYTTYKQYLEGGGFPSDFVKSLPIQPTERQIWEAVLACICFKAADFVSYLEKVPDGEPTDSVVWDDIAGHYSNMQFRIDPEEYARVDGAFTVLGTKARIIISNIPNLNRLSKNVKDHMTFEIFIGRNKLRKMQRVFRLSGKHSTQMREFKAMIEKPTQFDIFRIPDWAWQLYESKRIELAKEVFKALGETVDMETAPEGYISVADAVRLARDNGLKWGVATVQQGGSRGLWKKATANGFMFIEENSFMKMIEAEAYNPK